MSRLLIPVAFVAALAWPAAAAAQIQHDIVHAFTGNAAPAWPWGLVQASDGDFYVTTPWRRAFGHRMVFGLDRAAVGKVGQAGCADAP
jgi:hypothetical protein